MLLALTTVLCACNTFLLLIVISHLRTTRLNSDQDDSPVELARGAKIESFSVTDTTGTKLSQDSLVERCIIGFFSPSCDACVTTAPIFAARAPERAGSGRVFAIAVGEGSSVAELASMLEPTGHVVIEPVNGEMIAACRVRAFPAYLVVEHGRLLASSPDVNSLLWLGGDEEFHR